MSTQILDKSETSADASKPYGKQRLVVIGNGMAPGRALEKLFEQAPDAFEVTIFNAEPCRGCGAA